MFWKLLQIVTFFGVGFTGIYYQWTPNGLVLGLVSAICALAVTVLLGDLFRIVRRCWVNGYAKRSLLVGGEKRPKKRLLP
jgi:hypothetical protein